MTTARLLRSDEPTTRLPRPRYSYGALLETSQRVCWRLEDVIGGRSLDFSRPFLPEALARTEALEGLSPDERRVLNQVRGHGYLCTFGIVEEFIVPFVLDHVRPRLDEGDERVRALLQFAGEEAKHIHLFRIFADMFRAGFATPCDVIGPADEIGRTVLSHHPLSVALAILQIEWMTQGHYVDAVHDDRGVDPLFRSLLKHHWLEEAQHAKLDTLMVEALAAGCHEDERERALDGYLDIGAFLDGGIGQQAELDAVALERAIGRRLPDEQRRAMIAQQRQAMRWTFLGSGMTHPEFLNTVERCLGLAARARVEAVAPMFT
ncbi:MAG: diiron oxygenase [Planctomycetes bacterium]|nr:diiron oxygenase [Planctomycetota bacterium]